MRNALSSSKFAHALRLGFASFALAAIFAVCCAAYPASFAIADEAEAPEQPAVSAPVEGWEQNGAGQWMYRNANGKLATGFYQLGDKAYVSDANGILYTDCWVQLKGKWLRASGSGALESGWFNDGSGWYYLDGANGWVMLANTSRDINGILYAFAPSGVMITDSFVHLNGSGAGYAAPSGGVAQIGRYSGNTIILNNRGWVYANDRWFYGSPSNGSMAKGWVDAGGARYYMDPNTGMMRTGWLPYGNSWYYLDDSGAMAKGWRWVGGAWYFLNDDGTMHIGWKDMGGTWFYFDPGAGSMATGVREIDGTTYYFNADGAMVNGDAFTSKAQGYWSHTDKLLLVDCSTNQVAVFSGHQGSWGLMGLLPCTTGAPSSPTIKGEFFVGGRGMAFGSGYTCWYWTRFHGNYLFHSVLYQPGSMSNIQDGRLGVNASHGCVRLSIENARWIHDTIPDGTRVVVY